MCEANMLYAEMSVMFQVAFHAEVLRQEMYIPIHDFFLTYCGV